MLAGLVDVSEVREQANYPERVGHVAAAVSAPEAESTFVKRANPESCRGINIKKMKAQKYLKYFH
jgi:hypothetical protein